MIEYVKIGGLVKKILGMAIFLYSMSSLAYMGDDCTQVVLLDKIPKNVRQISFYIERGLSPLYFISKSKGLGIAPYGYYKNSQTEWRDVSKSIGEGRSKYYTKVQSFKYFDKSYDSGSTPLFSAEMMELSKDGSSEFQIRLVGASSGISKWLKNFYSTIPRLKLTLEDREIIVNFYVNSTPTFSRYYMMFKNLIRHFSLNPDIYNCIDGSKSAFLVSYD